MSKYKKHFVITDTQLKPKVPTAHLSWAGRCIAEYRPDVITIIGDWWDWPVFSSYTEKHKKLLAGFSIRSDYEAGTTGLVKLEKPFKNIKGYRPLKIFTKGNHEDRLKRYQKDNPTNDMLPEPDDFLRSKGWKVYPFLQPATVHGITYCHFFCRNKDGKVVQSKTGNPSAKIQGAREMRSTVAGHKQGLDTAVHETGSGRVRSVIAGSFYQHEEEYLTEQGNEHWQGCLMLHDVYKGDYDLEEWSLARLRRRYK